jgi:hypothetical protein
MGTPAQVLAVLINASTKAAAAELRKFAKDRRSCGCSRGLSTKPTIALVGKTGPEILNEERLANIIARGLSRDDTR